eukprot:gene13295-9133_t
MEHIMLRLTRILSSRSWFVERLVEFYPRSSLLLGLNVNRGAEVCIRFRLPGNKHLFFPFPEVMCTVLHELAHCEISRHDKKFWALYHQLVRECEAVETQLAQEGVTLYPPTPPQELQKGKKQSPTKRKNTKFSGGHRLGCVTPAPKTPEELRSMVARRGRERYQEFLLQRYRIERGDTWFEEHPPDVVLESSYKGVRGSWKCQRCGFDNTESALVCDSCSDFLTETAGKKRPRSPSPSRMGHQRLHEREREVAEKVTQPANRDAVPVIIVSENDSAIEYVDA